MQENKESPPNNHSARRSFFFGLLAGLLLSALLAGFLFLVVPLLLPSASLLPLPANCNLVQPIFSPGTSADLISLIKSANSSIDIEMYVFTDDALARELSAAASRGVRVRLILESRVTSSTLDKMALALRQGGVDLRWASTQFTLTHSKTMIIDNKTALVGSINFSKNAQNKNRESAVIMQGPALAPFISTFENDWPLATEAHPVGSAGGEN